ncbi:MAG: hypothetical protein ABFR90_11940, partial [Planctomycetota bacterium]
LYSEEELAWYLVGFFDSGAVVEAIYNPLPPSEYSPLAGGELQITLVTRFETGQWVYGTDVVKVK